MSGIRWQVRRSLTTGREVILGEVTAADRAGALRAAWARWPTVRPGEVLVQSLLDLTEEAREERNARRLRADGLPVQP